MSDVSSKALIATAGAGVAQMHEGRRGPNLHALPSSQHHVYLNTPGAAEYVDVSPRTLIDYRSRGGGPKWVRFGRAVRYRTDWLDQWAEEKAVTSTSQETAQARR
jgi:helix-turn-helix protein